MRGAPLVAATTASPRRIPGKPGIPASTLSRFSLEERVQRVLFELIPQFWRGILESHQDTLLCRVVTLILCEVLKASLDGWIRTSVLPSEGSGLNQAFPRPDVAVSGRIPHPAPI